MKALYYGDNLQVLRDSIATKSGNDRNNSHAIGLPLRSVRRLAPITLRPELPRHAGI